MAQNRLLTKDHFLLGTFATNCGGGMTVSTLPDLIAGRPHGKTT